VDRYKGALRRLQAQDAITQSTLSDAVKRQALINLSNGNFVTNTVGSGGLKNSVSIRFLFAAGIRMLRANLESRWFGGGQFIRGATWLKSVHCGTDSSLTPLETLLKAYDDMPDVVKVTR
jgi:hypothetical protein